MTKKDLERRNKYLLLQLKQIHDLTENAPHNRNGIWQTIGHIQYYSDPETIKENIGYIERYDHEYNFFEKDKDISEYE